MNFILSIYSAPSTPGAHSAYQFAKAVMAEGYQISQIFFYKEGIRNSLHSDSFSKLGVPLLVCSTAMFTRNIQKSALCTGYQTASLTQFFDALLKADRYVVFGN